jgi:hypothetical protein
MMGLVMRWESPWPWFWSAMRRDRRRRTPLLAAAVVAAGQTAGAYGAKSLSRVTACRERAAAAMTAATVAGVGEVGERCGALGSLAEPAGFRSIHSQRTAAANAPDKIA